MLAPRKKLWSTPHEVVNKAIEMLKLEAGDVLLDVGCGDGRVMIEAASHCAGVECIGVEIDEARAEEARGNIKAAGKETQCTVICGNALEQNFSQATKVFLYLIPRGLRIILPVLEAMGKQLDVVTYMAPFPAPMEALETLNVETQGHKDAKWPLYRYRLSKDTGLGTNEVKLELGNQNEACNVGLECWHESKVDAKEEQQKETEKEPSSRACPNQLCKCPDCTCGDGCTCGVSVEVVCDPCVAFKARMVAEKEKEGTGKGIEDKDKDHDQEKEEEKENGIGAGRGEGQPEQDESFCNGLLTCIIN